MKTLEKSPPWQITASCFIATASLLSLLLLCLAWELWLAPIRPGGSWLAALKIIPLMPALIGILKRRMYTYRWVSLLVWLYFAEGVVRATSEAAPARWLAGGEIALSLLLFSAC